MRTDAKIGVMSALIITLVAGGYFTFRPSKEEPISLGIARSEDASDRPATRPRPALTKESTADRSSTPGRRQASPGRPSRSNKIDGQQAGAPPQRLVGRDQKKTDRTPGRDSSSSSSPPLTRLTGGWSDSSPPSGSSPDDAASGSLDQRPGAHGLGDAGRSGKPDLVGVTTPGASDSSQKRRAPVGGSITLSPSGRKLSAGGRNETHTVQDGDTFSSLSNQYYGDERHIQDLIQANPQISNPNVLKIGVVLQIPPLGDAVRRGPARSARRTSSGAPSSARTYVVQSGDSLYKIARDELGDPSRWPELFELNRSTMGDNPSNLSTGAVLVLPAK